MFHKRLNDLAKVGLELSILEVPLKLFKGIYQ